MYAFRCTCTSKRSPRWFLSRYVYIHIYVHVYVALTSHMHAYTRVLHSVLLAEWWLLSCMSCLCICSTDLTHACIHAWSAPYVACWMRTTVMCMSCLCICSTDLVCGQRCCRRSRWLPSCMYVLYVYAGDYRRVCMSCMYMQHWFCCLVCGYRCRWCDVMYIYIIYDT